MNHSQTISIDMLVCPGCKSRLERGLYTLRCPSCRLNYSMTRGIADFIDPAGPSPRAAGNVQPDHDPGTFLSRLPNNALSNLVQELYSKIDARIYETPLWWPRLVRQLALTTEFTADDLIARIVSKARVDNGLILDVASGPATLGRRLAPASRGVFAIDMVSSMLEWGASLASRERIANIQFARAKADALPFTNAVFDAATFGGALHWMPTPAVALGEIARTLKRGAPLCGYTVLAGQRSEVCRKIARRGGHLFQPEELEAYLVGAGFTQVELDKIGELVVFYANRL